MPEYTLHDGRVVKIDPYGVSHTEYKALISGAGADEQIIGKATGLTAAEIEALPERDWRGLSVAVVKAVISPDPL